MLWIFIPYCIIWAEYHSLLEAPFSMIYFNNSGVQVYIAKVPETLYKHDTLDWRVGTSYAATPQICCTMNRLVLYLARKWNCKNSNDKVNIKYCRNALFLSPLTVCSVVHITSSCRIQVLVIIRVECAGIEGLEITIPAILQTRWYTLHLPRENHERK